MRISGTLPAPPTYPGETPVAVTEEAGFDVDSVPAARLDSWRVPVMFTALPGMLPTTLAADTVEMEASETAMVWGRFPCTRLAMGMAVIFVPSTLGAPVHAGLADA